MAVMTAILFNLLALSRCLFCSGTPPHEECVTRPIQTYDKWMTSNGSLRSDIGKDMSLDLSGNKDSIGALRIFLKQIIDMAESNQLRYLSLAWSGLERLLLLPMGDTKTKLLTGNLRYLTLMGNNFSRKDTNRPLTRIYEAEINATQWVALKSMENIDIFTKETIDWVIDLESLQLTQLIELDLRYCRIEEIHDGSFATMTNLQYLYLEGNKIHRILSDAFSGLTNLLHLDLSYNFYVYSLDIKPKNQVDNLMLEPGSFTNLTNLMSLDLSNTRLAYPGVPVLKELGPSMIRLSLCNTQIPSLNGILTRMRLRYLDISGNVGIQDFNDNTFDGIEYTLEVLYARRVSLSKFQPLRKLNRLTTLALTKNNIANLDKHVLLSMPNLMLLDMSDNRISSWHEELLRSMKNLKIFFLESNNVNLLSPAMLADFGQIEYLAMGRNEFVCNCYLRHFIERSIKNIEDADLEYAYNVDKDVFKYLTDQKIGNDSFDFIHEGILDHYSEMINSINNNVYIPIMDRSNDVSSYNYVVQYATDNYLDMNLFNFSYKLMDYSPLRYTCTDSRTNDVKSFIDVEVCEERVGEDIQRRIESEMILVYVVGGLLVFVFICIGCIIWKWWYVRYFFVMLKNTATMSLLGKNDDELNDSDKLYHYDVFVSYCHDDRNWVLDELLPQIENAHSINVCLHERDFQVGLSILENIISGIDRSRTILLVVSQEFLLSQWCQFEMHLAQHRLLETRREQLILVLLEDIPRRKRPNTLHYLMMTKTYLIWPKCDNKEDVVLFWKRLRKALLQEKYKANIGRISAA